MRSEGKAALSDLARDIPTTPDDVRALRRARPAPPADPFVALEALVRQLPAAARRQRRDTAAGRPDFEL